jgi:hypothetical protein
MAQQKGDQIISEWVTLEEKLCGQVPESMNVHHNACISLDEPSNGAAQYGRVNMTSVTPREESTGRAAIDENRAVATHIELEKLCGVGGQRKTQWDQVLYFLTRDDEPEMTLSIATRGHEMPVERQSDKVLQPYRRDEKQVDSDRALNQQRRGLSV